MPQGNGDPSLVMFGREVTPNQHALAEEFVLLDNFYCTGVLSADGHAWATEAYATDYLERHFGGFMRSYPYDGDDPLAYASSGFLWDNALAHGKTFRDYGEFVKAKITPSDGEVDRPLRRLPRTTPTSVKVEARPTVETLDAYTLPHLSSASPARCPTSTGPASSSRSSRSSRPRATLPNLIVMLLPNDHTDGHPARSARRRGPWWPTTTWPWARSSRRSDHSRFWPETAIFVVEDDPQAGLDHVDGHRTIGQVISPYTRRGIVDHTFYTQVGMVKTIELILGLPPMNQMDLAAPAMRNCFHDRADLRPFDARPNQHPARRDEPAARRPLRPAALLGRKSLELDLDDVDEADEDTFNRILWHATRGYDVPYPKLARADDDDDDDDDGD